MSIAKCLRNSLPSRKSILRATWLICACYALFCLLFYFKQEWFLLEPNVDPTGMVPSDLEGADYNITIDQQHGGPAKIHYRKYATPASPPKGTVFYLHGNKGNMDKCEWETAFFLELGYDVWTMDYRGFGGSSGTSSESALEQDAAAVYSQIIKQLKGQEESLVIWGRSFGSGVAASVAASNKPRMLVLETPYWSLVDAVRQKHPYIPSILFRYKLPSHEFLESVNCPIHLIHGTQDEKIPFNSSERLAMLREESNRPANGHAIMCGKHNLRDRREFAEISNKILK